VFLAFDKKRANQADGVIEFIKPNSLLGQNIQKNFGLRKTEKNLNTEH
jgi:hypothetical protein